MANLEVDSKQSSPNGPEVKENNLKGSLGVPPREEWKESPKNSFVGMVFLLVLSLVLSFIAPLFAPVPLVLISLIYGRKWGIIMGPIYLATSIGILTFGAKTGEFFPLTMVMILAGVFVFNILITEMIRKNIHPARGFFTLGWVLFLVFGVGVLGYEILNPGKIEQGLHKIVGEAIVELKDQKASGVKFFGMIENAIVEFEKSPKLIVGQVYKSLPTALFVYVFLGLWLNLAIVLGFGHLWKERSKAKGGAFKDFQFSLFDLAQFKTPDHFVWPLILALVGVLAADAFQSPITEFASLNMLFCLGVLYFFQGFGVYFEFLTFLKIEGFLKLAFIILTLTGLAQYVAIVGAFDMWFDFRRFFKKNKKDEGDFI